MNAKFFKVISVGIVAILIVGLICLSYEVQKLKKEMTQLSERRLAVAAFDQPKVAQRIPRRMMPQDFFEESWDPYAEMERVRRQMDALMRDRFWNEPRRHQDFPLQNTIQMSTNFKEEKDKYILRMDVLGMKKEDIRVEIKSRMLLIFGERSQEKSKKDAQYASEEQSFGYFSQSLPLPQDANIKGISVNYEDGVLAIEIPRLINKKSDSGIIKVKVR